MTATRGTTNRNARGGSAERRRRREWLVETFRADDDAPTYIFRVGDSLIESPQPPSIGTTFWFGSGVPACRCYRCGTLLTVDTVSPDRIVPGCDGGTYRRDNIRPACSDCQSEVGGGTRSKTTIRKQRRQKATA